MNPKDRMGSAKPNLSIIPLAPLMQVCAALTEGACKYGPRNWRDQKISQSIYLDAAIRHCLQSLCGEDIDEESGIDHVAKAIAGLVILLDAKIHGCTEDNRPKNQDLGLKEVMEKIAEINDKYPVEDRPEGYKVCEDVTLDDLVEVDDTPIDMKPKCCQGGIAAEQAAVRPPFNFVRDIVGYKVTFTDGRTGVVQTFDDGKFTRLPHFITIDGGHGGVPGESFQRHGAWYYKTGALNRNDKSDAPKQIASVSIPPVAKSLVTYTLKDAPQSDLMRNMLNKLVAKEQAAMAAHAERVAIEAEEAELESNQLCSQRTEAAGGSFRLTADTVGVGNKVLMSNDTEGVVILTDHSDELQPVRIKFKSPNSNPLDLGHDSEFWFGPNGFLHGEPTDNYFGDLHVVEVLGD